jgi:PAS domain S-box-containing protein
MVLHRQELEAAVAQVLREPSFASLPPGGLVLAWDAAARLVWVAPMPQTPSDAGELPTAAAERIKFLAKGGAPRQGLRLERLRFDLSRLAPPVICACRLIDVAGQNILVTAVVGPAPRRIPSVAEAGASAPAAAAEEPVRHAPVRQDPLWAGMPAVAPFAVFADPSAVGRLQERGTVRFVWQADAQGRFTEVSPALAEIVGSRNAAIVGRTWRDIEGDLVDDPSGEVETLFARRETWSSRTVFWKVEGSDVSVPVDFAGLPVLRRNGQLVGFRGFGLCRTEAVAGAAADRGFGAGFSSVRGEGMARLGPPAPGALEPLSAAQPGRAVAAPSGIHKGEAELAQNLSTEERNAFRQIARALGARFDPVEGEPAGAPATPVAPASAPVIPLRPLAPPDPNGARILERLPVGVLIHRGETPLFVNRALRDMLGYDDVAQLAAEGGIGRLFRGRAMASERDGAPSPVLLSSRTGQEVAAEARLTTVEWDGTPASLLLVRPADDRDPEQSAQALALEVAARDARIAELSSILDTATDGVVMLDEAGRVRSMNRSAEALFGYDQREVVGEPLLLLFATESHAVAIDYLDGLRGEGVATLLNDGREVLGRVRQGGTIPLFMTMGHVGDSPERTFCAVLRDITAFKLAEHELVEARRAAEASSAHKTDFLAKISHEIRTALNAIIGFAEVMMEERFGPVGNERYKDYLRDIHGSGRHVVSLVNDLLDLAKIESGHMELAFTSVGLNELVAGTVSLLQPQAARARIIMRTSFAPKLPPVVADERSVRQIVLNLVSNAIKFTGAGGQVIVSTVMTERGEVAFRVRDTGIGMSEQDLVAALEPFRQISSSPDRSGTGLGLPLTKALVDANRGALHITSARGAGTLAEVLFPPTRVLAD